MTASFAASGIVVAAPALAVMLGADVGTTLVAQLLSLDISWLSPVLIFGGLIAFHAGRRKRVRDLGRLAIGLGLLLLALSLIIDDSAPMQNGKVSVWDSA